MVRPPLVRSLVLVAVMPWCVACQPASNGPPAADGLASGRTAPRAGSTSSPSAASTTVVRSLGAWEGSGNRLVGSVISDSGRFRIRWRTRQDRAAGGGTFRLSVRSATSGRIIQVVADHMGEGSGSTDFVDDPRVFDFAVESTGLEWWFTVEEVFFVSKGAPS